MRGAPQSTATNPLPDRNVAMPHELVGRTVAWVAFLIALGGQVYALYFAHGPGELPFWQADKFVHFGVFGAVAFTGWCAGIPARWLLVALVIHAGASEAIQGLLLDRDASGFDSLADIAGTLVGLAVARYLPYLRLRR